MVTKKKKNLKFELRNYQHTYLWKQREWTAMMPDLLNFADRLSEPNMPESPTHELRCTTNTCYRRESLQPNARLSINRGPTTSLPACPGFSPRTKNTTPIKLISTLTTQQYSKIFHVTPQTGLLYENKDLSSDYRDENALRCSFVVWFSVRSYLDGFYQY